MSSLDDIWQNWIERFPILTKTQGNLEAAYQLLKNALENDHKILVCGNGGSAADSEHIAGDMVKSFLIPRHLLPEELSRIQNGQEPSLATFLTQHLQRGLSVYPLVSQSALSTAIANDVAGDMVFAQQVWAYGKRGDVLWAISTSGNSRNVLLAAVTARAQGMKILGLTGTPSGTLGPLCDEVIAVPEKRVDYIQTLHVAVYHILCEAIERFFFMT